MRSRVVNPEKLVRRRGTISSVPPDRPRAVKIGRATAAVVDTRARSAYVTGEGIALSDARAFGRRRLELGSSSSPRPRSSRARDRSARPPPHAGTGAESEPRHFRRRPRSARARRTMGAAWEGWFTVAVVVLAFGCLLWTSSSPTTS